MQKKEYYKHNLPHFQQPEQAYFITWSLKDAVSKHALFHFHKKLEIIEYKIKDVVNSLGLANSDSPLNKSRFGDCETQRKEIEKLKKEYYLLRKRYIKAYNDLLDAQRKPEIDLSKPANTKVLIDTLKFWENKKLKNHAFCILPNHVHWVVELFEKDEMGNPVYLQDILYSVKRFSSTQINKLENRKGALWQKESFETTIRDEKHLYYAIEYTFNNPVNAGWINDWKDWAGSWSAG